ncbi:MAG: TonB-dependent receptor [Proteobacteria bacterium]|nr:MAG: TonB-dependent receptor [Pseudomonadota bacterium]
MEPTLDFTTPRLFASATSLICWLGLTSLAVAGPTSRPASVPTARAARSLGARAGEGLGARPARAPTRSAGALRPLIGGRSTRGVVPPRLSRFVEARYPAAALRARVEATVRLQIELDARGRVRRVTSLDRPGHGLAVAAVAAARGFRFLPALSSGVPIPAQVVFRYRFVLPAPPSTNPLPRAAARVPRSASASPSPRPIVPPARRDPVFTTVVRGRRPARSASDFSFTFDTLRTDVPAAGATASGLLRRAPGVYISQHSGVGKAHQIFLRGFDAVHGQDVEIHVGGIPVNEVSHLHAQGYADLHFLLPEAVARLRVLEGAQDPRQGDFATAGSIDFDLGMQRRGLLGRITAGRFGLWRALAAWAPDGQPDETFVVAELAKGDGFGRNRAWRRGSAMGQWLVPLTSGFALRILASTYAGRFDSAGVLRADDLAAGRVGFFDSYDPNQGGASARHQLLIGLRHRGPRWCSGLQTYLVWRDLRLRHDFTGALLESRGDGLEQENRALTIGGRAQAKTRVRLFERRHRVEVGLRWRHDRVTQTQRRARRVDGVAYQTDVDADLAITDLGLYGDLELELWPRRLRLRGGLRAEAQAYRIDDALANAGAGSRRDAFGFFLGPKATLEARLWPGLKLFVGYGRGFRSPQALSLGQGERAPFAIVDSGEVGLAARYFEAPGGARLALRATGFLTHLDDDLVFDHAIGRNLFVGAARRLGVAWLAQGRPLSWLQISHSGTWVRATHVDSGDALPYAPTLVLRSDVDAQGRVATLFGRPLWAFGGLGWTVLGARPLPYGESSRPIHLVDVEAGVEWRDLGLSLQIVNLTDARWRDGEFVYASSFDPAAASPSQVPARHLTAGRPFTIQGTFTARY